MWRLNTAKRANKRGEIREKYDYHPCRRVGAGFGLKDIEVAAISENGPVGGGSLTAAVDRCVRGRSLLDGGADPNAPKSKVAAGQAGVQ